MIVSPPPATVTVALDGRPIPAYHEAFLRSGHTYAPLRPFVTSAADRLWYERGDLVIQRGNRIVRVPIPPRAPGTLDRTYVPLARVLRALGACVEYASRRVDVRFTRSAVRTPAPFDASRPGVAPRAVFTPEPIETPRPRWSGTPLPRRTPLPVVEPTPAG